MQESIFSEIAGVIRKRLRSKESRRYEKRRNRAKKEKKAVESAYINPVAGISPLKDRKRDNLHQRPPIYQDH